MTFNIAFFADSHIGYRAKVKANDRGINVRVQDGYDAFREILNQILNSDTKIDAVVHGGDLFHYSRPTIRDIKTVQHYLGILAQRGIPFYGLAGNHDATDDRSELAAVAVVDDPDRNIHALYKPYSQYEIADGIILHSVSHHGLGANAPEVKPVAGVLNLFTTHGAALDPKNKDLLRCADSPREQIIPVDLVTDDSFIAKLLGHYHSRYPVGGKTLNTWYAGSSVRRGFSDAPGERGWLLVSVTPEGQVEVNPRNIRQRSQFDLNAIDAEDINAADLMDLIEENMKSTMQVDDAPLVRQRIVNAPRHIREGLDRDRINKLSEHMLLWQLEFAKVDIKSSTQNSSDEKEKGVSFSGRQSVSVVDTYKQWVKKELDYIPAEYKEVVEEDMRNYLTQAAEKAAQA